MPRERKAVEAALEAKGFQRREGNHHYFTYVAKDGRTSRARTKTSHSPKARTLSDGLLGQMANQCRLTKPDFLKLVDCPLTRDEYERRLSEQGHLTRGSSR